jgi:hypothetical protein
MILRISPTDVVTLDTIKPTCKIVWLRASESCSLSVESKPNSNSIGTRPFTVNDITCGLAEEYRNQFIIFFIDNYLLVNIAGGKLYPS